MREQNESGRTKQRPVLSLSVSPNKPATDGVPSGGGAEFTDLILLWQSRSGKTLSVTLKRPLPEVLSYLADASQPPASRKFRLHLGGTAVVKLISNGSAAGASSFVDAQKEAEKILADSGIDINSLPF